jgi:alpha-glucosidase
MSSYRAAPAPAPPLAEGRFRGLGALAAYEVRGATLVLDAGGPRLAVTFLDDDVARVRLAPEGDFTVAGHGADAHEEPFSYAIDAGRAWPLRDIEVEEAEGSLSVTTAALRLVVTREAVRLRFETADGRVLLEDDSGASPAEATVDGLEPVHASFRMQPEAHFFGLGDKTFPLDRRGGRYTFWNADTYAYGPEQDPIYKSIPFMLGLHRSAPGWTGYGLFFDDTYRSELDLGEADPGRIAFSAAGGELRYYLFAGPDLKRPLRRYCDLTGHKPMPALWTLGYHQSRWNYHDEGYARWVAHEFRRRGIPLECLHLDIGHMDGYRVFTWSPTDFAEPRAMHEDLADLGVRTVVIVDPGVKVDPGYFAYDEGIELGAFCKNPDGSLFSDTVWPGDVHWPDFSMRSTRDWWGRLHRYYLDAGVTGVWNDMNEPAILGGHDFPDEVRFAFDDRADGGTDHREAHNVYGLLMARATHEGLRALRPNERPFLLTRACFSGSQRYAAAWTGDNVSTWEHLLLALRICQSLSASGLAFCGPDIGGFAGRPSAELYTRWMQAGTFFPFMRTHYSHEEVPEQEPWSFGPEAEDACRRFISLRYELLPYLYTAFVDCCASAEPPMKAMFLEHPDEPASHTADDQFYCGPSLIVAPVVHDGARERDVWLPSGTWYDFWTGERMAGDRVVRASAPLERIPVFARAGSVVAMHPPAPHTAVPAPEALTLRLYPGSGRSGTYFDDGISYAFEGGDYLRLHFSMSEADGGVELRIAREGVRGLPYRAFEWRVHAHYAGASADGRPLPLFQDVSAWAEAGDGVYHADGVTRVRTRTDVELLQIYR